LVVHVSQPGKDPVTTIPFTLYPTYGIDGKVNYTDQAPDWEAMRLGFNRWMQHTRNCICRRSVANETKAEDLLHGKSEGADVGALAER
jgi:hypothetical protein